jgi:site-specific recombinase XerD
LRLGDLDLQGGRARVLEKGRRRRWVFLDSVVCHALYVYISQERKAAVEDCVFIGQRGPLSTRGVWQALKGHAASAGITGPVNPHAFRHGAAKIWLQAGLNLSAVSALLGHSSIAITHTHYARWQVDELQEQHRRASPLNRIVLNSLLEKT